MPTELMLCWQLARAVEVIVLTVLALMKSSGIIVTCEDFIREKEIHYVIG